MPFDLKQAHKENDSLVEKLYNQVILRQMASRAIIPLLRNNVKLR